jgi:hypothetical protein
LLTLGGADVRVFVSCTCGRRSVRDGWLLESDRWRIETVGFRLLSWCRGRRTRRLRTGLIGAVRTTVVRDGDPEDDRAAALAANGSSKSISAARLRQVSSAGVRERSGTA